MNAATVHLRYVWIVLIAVALAVQAAPDAGDNGIWLLPGETTVGPASDVGVLAAPAEPAGDGFVAEVVPGRAGEPPATARYEAVADVYVSEAAPGVNYGAETQLRVDGEPLSIALLRFDVGELGDSTIERVELWVYANSSSAAGLLVHGVAPGNWSEDLVTAETAPAILAPLAESGPVTGGGWTTVEVRPAWDGSMIALALTTPGGRAISLGSRESETPPRLVVARAEGTPGPEAPPSSGLVPGEPGTVTIVAVGDIACEPGLSQTEGRCRQAVVADLAAGVDPVAVLALGDLQYEEGTLRAFEASYDASWGRLLAITYPAVGNHEYLTAGAAGYFDYFGARAGDRAEGYYSFDVGTWHVVALNSNCSRVGGCGSGSRQYAWLQADLAATSRNCIVAFSHHPRFSSGVHGDFESLTALWELLYRRGAELFLSGHDHNYERLTPMTATGSRDDDFGIRQFVVGTGGKNIRPIEASSRTEGLFEGFGLLRLSLSAEGYEWAFIDEGGRERDMGSAACHDAPTP